MTGGDARTAAPASPARRPPRPRPTRQTWRVFLLYAVAVQVVWLAVYGGASWLTASHERRVSPALPWDAAIPFIPAAAVVYLSLPLMLWLAPVFLPTPREIRRFGNQLILVILLAGIGFVALPADQPPVPPAPAGLGGALFRLADRMNLDHNLFPSLHVSMATLAALAYSQRARTITKVALAAYACAIAASTLLIRDHYIADVAAGAMLGAVIFLSAGGQERNPPRPNAAAGA